MRNANIALLAAIGIHGADHLAQERGIGALATEVVVGGQVVLVVALVSLAFTLRAHPRAPEVAMATGAFIALGVTVSHFVPAELSAFSDPYADLSLPLVSWLAAGVEVAAAAVLATVALRARYETVPV